MDHEIRFISKEEWEILHPEYPYPDSMKKKWLENEKNRTFTNKEAEENFQKKLKKRKEQNSKISLKNLPESVRVFNGTTLIKNPSKKQGELWIKNGTKEQVNDLLSKEFKEGFIDKESFELALKSKPPLIIDRIKSSKEKK